MKITKPLMMKNRFTPRWPYGNDADGPELAGYNCWYRVVRWKSTTAMAAIPRSASTASSRDSLRSRNSGAAPPAAAISVMSALGCMRQ